MLLAPPHWVELNITMVTPVVVFWTPPVEVHLKPLIVICINQQRGEIVADKDDGNKACPATAETVNRLVLHLLISRYTYPHTHTDSVSELHQRHNQSNIAFESAGKSKMVEKRYSVSNRSRR